MDAADSRRARSSVRGRCRSALGEISPWIDARFMGPIEPVLASVEAQRAPPLHQEPSRGRRAALLPAGEVHRRRARHARRVHVVVQPLLRRTPTSLYTLFNDADRPGPEIPRCPATPRELWPRWIREGWFDWEPDGWPFWSHHHHLSTWWDCPRPAQHLVRALRRSEGRSPKPRCGASPISATSRSTRPRGRRSSATVGLDAMRTRSSAVNDDPMRSCSKAAPARFFFKGEAGRWRDVLTDEDLALYDTAAATLDPELRRWLEGGRSRCRCSARSTR